MNPNPIKPTPNIARVPGSGTAVDVAEGMVIGLECPVGADQYDPIEEVAFGEQEIDVAIGRPGRLPAVRQ